jgi:hypothetical protein
MAWEQLYSILVEASGYAREERTTPPTACPYDGEPLDAAPDNGLFCPLGNYRWPRDRRII